MINVSTLIIFTVLAIVAFVILIVDIVEKDGILTIIGAIALIACVSVIVGCIKNINKTYNTVPAIEVYRGNTSLQITYIDSIPQDTIVVYKRKVLHNL